MRFFIYFLHPNVGIDLFERKALIFLNVYTVYVCCERLKLQSYCQRNEHQQTCMYTSGGGFIPLPTLIVPSHHQA